MNAEAFAARTQGLPHSMLNQAKMHAAQAVEWTRQSALPKGAALMEQAQQWTTKTVFPPLKLPPLDHGMFWRKVVNEEGNTAIVANGGGMAGVIEAGMLSEWDKLNLTNKVKMYAGVSVGAVNLAHLLGSKSRMPDPGIYYNTYATTDFIRPGWRPGRLNLGFLRDALIEYIDPAIIRDTPSEFHVGITRLDGKGELHDTRNYNNTDMIDLLVASAAAPYASHKLVSVKDNPSADGNINGLPIKLLVDQGYDNIGVLMNQPLEGLRTPFKEYVVLNTSMLRRYPAAVRRATTHRRRNMQQTIRSLETPGVTAALFAPHTAIVDWMSIDPKILKRGEQYGREMLLIDFEKHVPREQLAIAA